MVSNASTIITILDAGGDHRNGDSVAPMKGKFPNGLKAAMERAGVKSANIARAIGTAPQNIQRLRDGERELTVWWAHMLAQHVPGTSPEELVFASDQPKLGEKTPIVGYVGAGAVFAPYEVGTLDEIDRPAWANERTVAAEIRGDSLGSMFNEWLVYYDDVHNEPTSQMLGKLCIVWLVDSRVMAKSIERSKSSGLYTLRSTFSEPIYDVAVERCALIKHMSPRGV